MFICEGCVHFHEDCKHETGRAGALRFVGGDIIRMNNFTRDVITCVGKSFILIYTFCYIY